MRFGIDRDRFSTKYMLNHITLVKGHTLCLDVSVPIILVLCINTKRVFILLIDSTDDGIGRDIISTTYPVCKPIAGHRWRFWRLVVDIIVIIKVVDSFQFHILKTQPRDSPREDKKNCLHTR